MPADLAPVLLAFRERHRLTQRQLSALLGNAERTVQRWEAGRQRPDLYLLAALRWYDEHPAEVGARLREVRAAQEAA